MVKKSLEKFLSTKTFSLTTFGEPDKTSGRVINKSALKQVLDSKEFKEDLNNRRLFGCFSHEIRQEIEDKREKHRLPYVDLIANSGEVCNILTDIGIQDNQLVGDISIISNKKGREVQALFDSGTNIQVSMATRAKVEGSEWILKDILGVDFTMNPAFETREVTKQFSAGSFPNGDRLVYFSLEDDSVNFSVTGLREYIRESQRAAKLVLKRRLDAVAQYINSLPDFNDNAEISRINSLIRSYIRSYLLDWVNKAIYQSSMGDEGDEGGNLASLNLLLYLGLNRLLGNAGKKAARKLQRVLIRAATSVLSTGYMPNALQKRLNTYFGIVLNELFTDYIGGKISPEKKFYL